MSSPGIVWAPGKFFFLHSFCVTNLSFLPTHHHYSHTNRQKGKMTSLDVVWAPRSQRRHHHPQQQNPTTTKYSRATGYPHNATYMTQYPTMAPTTQGTMTWWGDDVMRKDDTRCQVRRCDEAPPPCCGVFCFIFHSRCLAPRVLRGAGLFFSLSLSCPFAFCMGQVLFFLICIHNHFIE